MVEVTKEVLPPRVLPPVRAIDIGTAERARIGGITIRGGVVGEPLTTAQRAQLAEAAEASRIELQRQTLIRQRVQEFGKDVRSLTRRLQSSFLQSIRGLTRTQRVKAEIKLKEDIAKLEKSKFTQQEELSKKTITDLRKIKGLVIDPELKFKKEFLSRIGVTEKITIRRLPPTPLIKPERKIIFGDPSKFAKSFSEATGSKSFTIAIPIRKENGKVFVQDFSFKFENGRLVSSRKTGSALLKPETFLAADKRRRDRNPGFTFGDTRIKEPILEQIIVPSPQRQTLIKQKVKEIAGNVDGLRRKLQSFFSASTKGLTGNQKAKAEVKLKDVLSKLQANRISEQAKLDKQNIENLKKVKGFVIDPTLKFLGGELKFQREFLAKITKRKPGEIRTIEQEVFDRPTLKEFKASMKKDFDLSDTQIDKILSDIKKGRSRVVIGNNKFQLENGKLVASRSLPFKIEEGFDFIADKLLRVSEIIVKKVPPIRKAEEIAIEAGLGVPREQAVEILADLFKFIAVDPVIGRAVLGKKAKAELSKTRFSALSDVLGSLEKEVAKRGTTAEQLRFLSEKKRTLKTKRARDNFDKFVETLIEKEIIKLPKVEIAPGVTAKGLPITRPKVTTSSVTGEISITLPPTVPVAKITVPITAVTPTRPKTATQLREQQRTITNQRFNQLTTQIEQQKNVVRQSVAQGAATSLIEQQRQRVAQLQRQQQQLRRAQRAAFRVVTIPLLALKPGTRTITSRITGKKIQVKRGKVPPPFAFRRKPKVRVKRKPVKLKKIGFNTFVKSKGKFKKQNLVPLTRKKAFNLGSFLTDKSTARTFQIKLAKRKAQKPKLRVPPKYFEKNKNKFRGKKIKGKIQPIKNLAIEKVKFAIDSRGEKRQLSAARIRARLFKAFKKRSKK